jgi:predicted GTPase
VAFPSEVGATEETEIVGLLDRLWKAIGEVEFSDLTRSGAEAEDTRTRAQAIAPVVWLLGKTGAGKTAIVAALTGDPRAAVGEGFEACTQTAAFYDVPREVPLLRFLDTRGLGEADYDPAHDIAWCEDQSHLVLVVMQVADPAQHTVLQILRQVRQRHPEWPVIVAQTGLHRLYSAELGHPNPYPYTGGAEDEEIAVYR